MVAHFSGGDDYGLVFCHYYFPDRLLDLGGKVVVAGHLVAVGIGGMLDGMLV